MQRLLTHVSWVEMSAGSTIISEGDVGDRFYVIADGAIDISRGGRHLAQRGPGQYVGEIALLRDVPRTATVTAAYDVRLLTLDREPFLEAVTGHPHALATAHAGLNEMMRE